MPKCTVSQHDQYKQYTIDQLSNGANGEEQIQELLVPTQQQYTVILLYLTNGKDTQLANRLLTPGHCYTKVAPIAANSDASTTQLVVSYHHKPKVYGLHKLLL